MASTYYKTVMEVGTLLFQSSFLVLFCYICYAASRFHLSNRKYPTRNTEDPPSSTPERESGTKLRRCMPRLTVLWGLRVHETRWIGRGNSPQGRFLGARAPSIRTSTLPPARHSRRKETCRSTITSWWTRTQNSRRRGTSIAGSIAGNAISADTSHWTRVCSCLFLLVIFNF